MIEAVFAVGVKDPAAGEDGDIFHGVNLLRAADLGRADRNRLDGFSLGVGHQQPHGAVGNFLAQQDQFLDAGLDALVERRDDAGADQ